MIARSFGLAALFGLLSAVLPSSALARKYTLNELLEIARTQNPGLRAGDAATRGMQAQVSEARRNWLPQGDLTSFVAPVPRVECEPGGPNPIVSNDQTTREDNCIQTNASPSHGALNYLTNFAGAYSRTDLKLVQPIWDFGKISAGVSAAEAGVVVTTGRTAGARADVELNVRKAYWGLKLARELRSMLEEGQGYLDTAQKKIEKQLADGSGNATVTDKLRLKTVRTEIEVRLLEATRLEAIARSGLRALLGSESPEEVDVDDEDFEALEVPARPLAYYEEQARLSRPEVRTLDYAVKAKRALADLEHRKLYPDLVLIGQVSFAYAPTIDSPASAFASNPFNGYGGGIAAAMRLPLDFGPKLARGARTRAEAEEIEERRLEALGGVGFEVAKAYLELAEAQTRLVEVNKGEKAGKAWVAAVTQNFALGLADARDFSDALLQSFKMRTFALQAVYDLNISTATLSRAAGTNVP
jgi:outer membrane protein TolC